MRNIIKFKRGTIWYYKDDTYNNGNYRAEFRTHIQTNSRPVLIISSDYGNIHSPIVNVVPITSQDKQCSVNVPIINEDGDTNYILCNQIKSIDASNLVTYMGCIDNETMVEVEKTINMVLGITSPRIEKSLKDIENTIQNIIDSKLNQPEPQTQIDNVVENIASRIEDVYRGLVDIHSTNLIFEDTKLEKEEVITESDNKMKDQRSRTKSKETIWLLDP